MPTQRTKNGSKQTVKNALSVSMGSNPISAPDADLLDELKFECERRQSEIFQNDSLTIQIATYILAFAGVVMGFAIPSDAISNELKIVISLAVAGVAYLGLRQHIGRTQSTYINAAYQRVFIESQTREIKWETRLANFRANPPKHGVIDTVSDLGLLYGAILFLNTSLAFYFIWDRLQYYQWRILAFQVQPSYFSLCATLFVLVVIGSWYREWAKYSIYDEKRMEEYVEAWIRVKKKEQKV